MGLGKLLCEPMFPYLKNEDNNNTHPNTEPGSINISYVHE